MGDDSRLAVRASHGQSPRTSWSRPVKNTNTSVASPGPTSLLDAQPGIGPDERAHAISARCPPPRHTNRSVATIQPPRPRPSPASALVRGDPAPPGGGAESRSLAPRREDRLESVAAATTALIAAMSQALQHESTTQATLLALQGVLDATGADAGRVLLLDLRTGRFGQRAQVGHSVHEDVPAIAAAGHAQEGLFPPLDLLQIAARSRRSAWWARDARSAPSTWHEPPAQRRLVRPVMREGTPIALVDIEGPSDPDFPELSSTIDLFDQVIAKICERRSTLRLLYELQQPIGTDRTRFDYYEHIAQLISKASGMEFVAVREYDAGDGLLRCVAADGFGVERGQLHELDLSPLDDHPSFRRALAGETVVEPTVAVDYLTYLRRLAPLQDVRCFVAIPIVVNEDIVGVVSIAARCPYQFSRVELRGFETIANAIGVAIANFKNLHSNSDHVRRLASVSAGALSDLLAQAARHEAKLYLDNAQKRLYLATESLSNKRPGDKDLTREIMLVSEVSAQLKHTRDSLEKMKTNALIWPGQSPVRTDVRDFVLAARNQVLGELDAYDVTVGAPSAGSYVQVIPEAVTLAFLHLLQNSIFAFQSTKARRRGRRIDVTIAARQAGSDTLHIIFADNATGIDPTRLTIPDHLKDMPWEEALFECGVTGSSEGTGFGLYLVRTLLDKAGGGTPGSVELVEHKNRVVFSLTLPGAD